MPLQGQALQYMQIINKTLKLICFGGIVFTPFGDFGVVDVAHGASSESDKSVGGAERTGSAPALFVVPADALAPGDGHGGQLLLIHAGQLPIVEQLLAGDPKVFHAIASGGIYKL